MSKKELQHELAVRLLRNAIIHLRENNNSDWSWDTINLLWKCLQDVHNAK